jgi:hypothetical protein
MPHYGFKKRQEIYINVHINKIPIFSKSQCISSTVGILQVQYQVRSIPTTMILDLEPACTSTGNRSSTCSNVRVQLYIFLLLLLACSFTDFPLLVKNEPTT